MEKKVLYVLAITVGIIFTTGFLVGLIEVIVIVASSSRATFKIGFFLGNVAYLIIGVILIRYGYKKFNPKINKEKESIEDIGQK